MRDKVHDAAAYYSAFEHTADLGLLIEGTDRADLFAKSATALFDVMMGIASVKNVEERAVEAEGADDAELFINFLREVLALYTVYGFALSRFTVDTIEKGRVTGTAEGEMFDPERHTVLTDIKAVTYHMCRCSESAQGWKGRVVLDV